MNTRRLNAKYFSCAALLLIACTGYAQSASDRAQSASKPQSTRKSPMPAENGATKSLHALFEEAWEYGLSRNPERASELGDRRWNDKWPDLTLASLSAEHEQQLKFEQRLAAIDRSQLSADDQLNYDLFKHGLEDDDQAFKLHVYLIPLNQRDGIQTSDQLTDAIHFDTVKDYEDWITRLKTFPTYMDQTLALLQEGLKEGIKHSKITMERLPGQIDKQLVSPEESGFYAPFKRFPKTISAADQQRLAAAGREAISSSVLPAFRKMKQFFVTQYVPNCYDQVGVWQWPNGAEVYAFGVRRFTTTDLTPAQIHEIGLSEVKRIRAEMEEVKTKSGFKGTMPEFFTFLRTDPKFFYKSGDELLEGSRSLAKRIDPTLVKLFGKLPRTPYGVQPIPMLIAPDTTTAYYFQPSADGSRAGTYFVNLYKPDTRPKWEMMALTLHEAVPGHHLQIALGQELTDIPKFRRFGGYTAFVEGWGLYSESLGEEVGLYDDIYSRFGRLTYEMWRAVRLVVDTGMHYKHWTRKQAIDYFMENAAKNELDVTNEIDRYIAWPGQALAYKIGELKIKELRKKATQELGPKFDVREFHDVVLGSGALPLDVLETKVNGWIAEKKH
jgi:uncharacterized protein (DUF885 family)